jgi:riboflavin kinase/FMN adenylyltransferase
MKIIYPQENSKINHTATIGFFDGVHLGHHFVIERLKNIAENNHSSSLIITFGRHPRQVLQADFQPKLLTTLSEKLELLDKSGVDACAVLDFTPEMAKLSAYDFMHKVLKEQYNVNRLLIGYDHRFGNNRQETFADYVQYGKMLGIEIVELDCFSTDEAKNISSSEIRKTLQKGQIERTNSLLGYNYFFEGRVIAGFKIGRKIGFPTANLQVEDTEKQIPDLGVYAVKIHFAGKEYAGMLNIGNRPTLENGNNISIEAHIFNFDNNVYDQTLRVEFLRKIRDEKKFESIEELIEQLEKDKKSVLDLY